MGGPYQRQRDLRTSVVARHWITNDQLPRNAGFLATPRMHGRMNGIAFRMLSRSIRSI